MADKLIRIKASTNFVREVVVTGSAIIVKSGGWVTHRLHWEAPSSEPTKDNNSEPLINGRAYIPPQRRFTRFWISTETLQRAAEDILLQVVDEVSSVVVMNEKRANVETQLLASSDTFAVLPPAGITVHTLLYTDQVWAATTDITDTDRRMYWPARYLAGGCVGDQPFFIKTYAKVSSQNGSAMAPYAAWHCDQVDANNPSRFGIDFQMGARDQTKTFVTTSLSPLQKVPFPIYGISIYVVTATATDMTFFQYSILAASDN